MKIEEMKGLRKWHKADDFNDHAAHLKQHYTCYRDLGKYKIYSAGCRKTYGGYCLLDVKANQGYELSLGHYGGIRGFINILQGKGNNIPPLKILELARSIVKKYKVPDDQNCILLVIGQLGALEELAKTTNNPDIAKDIKDLWPPKR